MEEPGKEVGSEQQEARTCPVCGTKFFATADSGFCPVCILRGATGGESATTGEPGLVSGSAESPREAEGASRARRQKACSPTTSLLTVCSSLPFVQRTRRT